MHVRDKRWVCFFCDSSEVHTPFRCKHFCSLNPRQRNQLVIQKKLCGNCLGYHHKKDCASKNSCFTCGAAHHTLLHPDSNSSGACSSLGSASSSSSSSRYNSARPSSVNRIAEPQFHSTDRRISIVQTALVRVRNSDQTARIFLDTGSEESYIRKEFAEQVSPKYLGMKTHKIETFGGHVSDEVSCEVYQLEVSSRHENHWVSMRLITLPVLCRPCSTIPASTMQNVLNQFPDIQLADEYSSEELSIDILLGMDAIPQILTLDAPLKVDRLLMTPTIFGFVLGGTAASDQNESCARVAKTLRSSTFYDEIPKLWDVETIGILPPEQFQEPSIDPQFNGERYEVSLPWLSDQRPCMTFSQAQHRNASFRRMSKERQLEYIDNFNLYHDLGILEPASSIGGNFIPHHGVIRKNKIRVVYNASAKPWKGSSLNDCLSPGPNMLADLGSILLRFRSFRYPLIADVEKAFLMVGVKTEDREYLKIAWIDHSNEVKVSRFTRVCFGLNCGPYLLLETIRYHLAQLSYENSDVIEHLKKGLYMDDEITGSSTISSVLNLKENAIRLFKLAGMNLRGFLSVPEIQRHWDPNPVLDTRTVLGMQWIPHSDMVGVSLSLSSATTKREVASSIASIFDPLGLASPWTISLRIFLQSLWKENLEWDDPLPNDIQVHWDAFFQVSLNQTFFVPRFIQVDTNSELHIFSDASLKAYCSVAYVKTRDTLQLLCSRSRVAPLKPELQLPKLELMGALLSVRMVQYILTSLGLKDIRVQYYTDSMIVLGWIRGVPTNQFVRNRVQEIRLHSSSSSWSHVCGDKNPADWPSRGTSIDSLNSSIWTSGPEFLQRIPVIPSTVMSSSISSDHSRPTFDFPIKNFSSLKRLTRVTAWVLRFSHNANCSKQNRRKGDLSLQELHDAKIALIRNSQLSQGYQDYLAVMGGEDVSPRSQIWNGHASWDPFNKIILCNPRNGEPSLPWLPMPSALGTLVIQDTHHQMYHMGIPATTNEVLRSFWMIRCRRHVKKTISSCSRCRRIQSRKLESPEGSIPRFRTQPSRPFSSTGLDHFGPLLTKNGNKHWCLLFTCAVTRAVHLELVSALDTHETGLAIRRFFNRRGSASFFLSDNGKSFVTLAKLLKGLVRWDFIPPSAPWWGGYWERVIGTIKGSCKKTLGNSGLSETELRTVLTDLEDRINRRPLLVWDDSSITPAHFLFSGPPPPLHPMSTPTEIPEITSDKLIRMLQHRQNIASHLWARWKAEYLPTLRNWRCKKNSKPCPLSIGDIVLIAPPDGVKFPRNLWPLGRVTELHQGSDGKIRSVTLKTKSGVTSRPLRRLYLLEFGSTQDQVPDLSSHPPNITPDTTGQIPPPSKNDSFQKRTRSGVIY